MTSLPRVPAIVLVLALSAMPVQAGDWPQILGPERSGVTREALPYRFADGGPAVRWKAELGQGFAGVAVAQGRVFVFDRTGDRETLSARSTEDGSVLWEQSAAAAYSGGIVADDGPRAVPTVADGRVFALGAGGSLRAVEAATGKLLWSEDLAARYEAPEGYFGFGSAPIVDGERVIVLAGGKGGSIVALEAATGQEAWRAGDDGASYSSPILARLAGRRQLIVASRLFVQGLDPKSGRMYWQQPFGRRGPTVVAAVPQVASGSRLFFTSSYGVGALLLELAPGSVESVWARDGRLSSQYATPVVIGEHLYGSHGREDRGAADYRALDLGTGRVLWTEKDFGVAHTITDRERLLIQRLDGTLVLALAKADRFQKLAEARVTSAKTRALPAHADGTLYVRTTPDSGTGELLALELELGE